MIEREGFFMIKDLKSKGLSTTQIAEICDLDRKTVSKWAKAQDIPTYKPRPLVKSKLDDYKDHIRSRMNEGCLNATVIFDEIVLMGYTGKMTILRVFMKNYREPSQTRATRRFETPPGKQAQVDWGEFVAQDAEGKKIKYHAFVMIMGHSRKTYLEFTENEKMETLIGCHERAFQYFGGLPETILYDNMKTVVKHSHETGENKWNQQFLSFCRHHDFTPVRCRPYNPRCKGKVENGVKYIRRNFWPRIRAITSLADLNQQALLWLDTICNERLHKTTHEKPNEAFKREQLSLINPIPFIEKMLHTRKVMNDCFITFETNLYSVPFIYVGVRVGVKDLHNGYIEIYAPNGDWIERFEKPLGKYQKTSNKKHFEGMIAWSQKKVACTAPKLIPDRPPKVHQRPLSVYDSFLNEVIS